MEKRNDGRGCGVRIGASSSHISFFKTILFIYTASNQTTRFYPEDAGSMYLWNIGNIVYNHTVYNNPRTELTSMAIQFWSLKSVITILVFRCDVT
jgi:hypothetical protein